MEPINLFELEAIAREKLSREAYDYYASGAHDEVTLRENRAAYDRLSLAYRVLVDVSRRDMATTVLGQPVAMPIVVKAPALGARAVLLGRPVLWGLAADVAHVLRLLRDELDLAMALAGAATLAGITRDLVRWGAAGGSA